VMLASRAILFIAPSEVAWKLGHVNVFPRRWLWAAGLFSAPSVSLRSGSSGMLLKGRGCGTPQGGPLLLFEW
jgi:hypothetical protein